MRLIVNQNPKLTQKGPHFRLMQELCALRFAEKILVIMMG